jgi:hypothetical protein
VLLAAAIWVLLRLYLGDRTWLLGAMAAVVAAGSLMPILAIRNHTKASMAKLLQLEDNKALVDISGGWLRVSSKLGRLEVPLDRISRIWCYPDSWLLLSDRSILMTLPLEGVPPHTVQAWTEEFRAAGARVA